MERKGARRRLQSTNGVGRKTPSSLLLGSRQAQLKCRDAGPAGFEPSAVRVCLSGALVIITAGKPGATARRACQPGGRVGISRCPHRDAASHARRRLHPPAPTRRHVSSADAGRGRGAAAMPRSVRFGPAADRGPPPRRRRITPSLRLGRAAAAGRAVTYSPRQRHWSLLRCADAPRHRAALHALPGRSHLPGPRLTGRGLHA